MGTGTAGAHSTAFRGVDLVDLPFVFGVGACYRFVVLTTKNLRGAIIDDPLPCRGHDDRRPYAKASPT